MTDKTVHLDVGGRIYRVSKSLLEMHPTSMLARLVSDTWNTTEEDGSIFIDRNGDRFQSVLDYLRDPEFMAPHLLSDPLICRELDYFGIPYDPIDVNALPLPNLQPGLRDRAIKAGVWVFQAMGMHSHISEEHQKPATIRCHFGCDIRYDARGLELCAIASALSAEQLSELWLREYGMQCSSIERNRRCDSINFNVMAVPFVPREEAEEP